MQLLDHVINAPPAPLPDSRRSIGALDETAARRSLRQQIARLERQWADTFVTGFQIGGVRLPSGTSGEPRLLDLGELEHVRDELAGRLRSARVTIAERADIQFANRLRLERMLLDPAKHRFARISRQDIGEPGCGAWHVKPRLGLIGMMMGWWQVKLSSGCPLAKGHGATPRPDATFEPATTPRQRSGAAPSRMPFSRPGTREWGAGRGGFQVHEQLSR